MNLHNNKKLFEKYIKETAEMMKISHLQMWGQNVGSEIYF